MTMTRWLIALVVTSLCGGCTGLRFVVDMVPMDDSLKETVVLEDRDRGRDKVALIDVTGLLVDAPRSGLLKEGDNPVDRLAEALRKAEDDTAVRSVILRVNSPGGTVTASDVMYRELEAFRQRSGKPVVILMGTVAASGGYYISLAGDEILAHPTTITGSIGVLMQTFNVSEGMRRIGIRADAITSGPNKDMASPFEPMTADHRQLLQDIVNEFYVGFRQRVTDSRPAVSPADIDWVTDGRVVTGKRASEVGLVDGVGDLRAAFDAAKRRGGVERARLVKYHRPRQHVGSAYARTPAAATQINLMQLNLDGARLYGDSTGFFYLWDPVVWGKSD